jgi:hypothetical protein
VCWELTQLEHVRGEKIRAGQLETRARAEVEFIVAHAGTAALRETFLAREEVRRITG